MHPDLYVEKLSDEWLLPLCSPRLLEGEQPLRSPQDLPRFPLIQVDLPGMVPTWDRLVRMGIDGIDTTRGLRLNVADHALDAASEGSGVVLAYKLVASRESRSDAWSCRSGRSCRCPAAPTISCAPRARRTRAHQGLPRLAVRRDAGNACRFAGDAAGRGRLGSRARRANWWQGKELGEACHAGIEG